MTKLSYSTRFTMSWTSSAVSTRCRRSTLSCLVSCSSDLLLSDWWLLEWCFWWIFAWSVGVEVTSSNWWAFYVLTQCLLWLESGLLTTYHHLLLIIFWCWVLQYVVTTTKKKNPNLPVVVEGFREGSSNSAVLYVCLANVTCWIGHSIC